MKKVLALALSLALIATMAISTTVAYLTSEDSDVNVMTLGNVKIEQHEYERAVNEDGSYSTITVTKADGSTEESYELVEFEQKKPLYPVVGNPNAGYTDTYARFEQLSDKASGGQAFLKGIQNGQDKIVLVENTGKSDAYVRTIIAFEMGSLSYDEWMKTIFPCFSNKPEPWTQNWVEAVEIDGYNYAVVETVYTGYSTGNMRHNGGILPAGEWTYNNLAEIYMASEATNETCKAIDGNGNGTYDVLVLSQAVQTAGFDSAAEALEAGFGKATAENVADWFGGMHVPGTAFEVTNSAELAAALDSASAGDVIKMAPGEYGKITLDGTIKDVTINGTSAVAEYVEVAENTVLDNITIEGMNIERAGADLFIIPATASVDNLTFKNVTFKGDGSKGPHGIYTKCSGAEIILDGCSFDGVSYPIYNGSVKLLAKNTSFKDSASWVYHSHGTMSEVIFSGCTFDNTDGIVKTYGWEQNGTFVFENNKLIGNCGHDNLETKMFAIDVANATTQTVSGNTKDGVEWNPGSANGLNGLR